MQVTGKKGVKLVRTLGITGAVLLASGVVCYNTMAMVVGRCDMCHTMHNSQNGGTVVSASDSAAASADYSTAARWGTTLTTITHGTSAAEQARLLKTDCVGCHSSTGGQTILTDANGNRVPIVFNTTSYPAQPLAGGNFFNVSTDSAKGHNVFGISGQDSVLSVAPGNQYNCGSSCHTSLAIPDSITNNTMNIKNNGCQACHNRLGHHNATDKSYRYLGGHGGAGVDIVEGGGNPTGSVGLKHNPYESVDWEQVPTTANHNFYRAPADLGSGPTEDRTNIGAFCAGCHKMFHAMGTNNSAPRLNGGDDNTEVHGALIGLTTANSSPVSPWMRHPSNVNIPQDGEYQGMFGVVNYSPTIPVARVDGTVAATIQQGDQVFCLSCHRAHASQYDDALRFDYTGMIAHRPNAATDGTGCFYCHTTKDNT